MMRKFGILIGVLFFFLLSSFNPFSYTPPGTKKLSLNGEELYVDRSEVLNAHWAEYLHWLEEEYGKDSPEYQEALPKETVWCSIYGEELEEIVESVIHGEYVRHPVIGITHEQAEAFCKWRSDRVNEKYEGHTTRYRLLTPQEYKAVREAGVECKEKSGPYPYPRKSEAQRVLSKKRIQGICGNVQELTSAPDSIWSSEGMKEKRTFQQKEEENPTLIGFRCVAELE